MSPLREILPENYDVVEEETYLRLLRNAGTPSRAGFADIVIGLCPSGQWRELCQTLAAGGARLISAESAKPFLPEMSGNQPVIVHPEAVKIMAEVLGRVVSAGEGLVLPLIGRDPRRLRELRDELRRRGYAVRLHYVHVPVEEAASRVVTNLEESGRFFDPLYVWKVDDAPRRTFDEVRGDAEWTTSAIAT